jgi:dipeptidyl-peptidase-4
MKNIFLGASLLLCLNGLAQKKQLSEQQMLRNEKTTIVTPLPQVLGWVNDESFLINKKEHPDSAFKPFLVDCKTGKSTPSSTSLLSKKEAEVYTVSTREGEIYLSFPGRSSRKLTSTPETEINPTLSPDQEWVAFTRKNDLYTCLLYTSRAHETLS